MGLRYRQRRMLRRIDRALRQSDPVLASMLAIFDRLHAGQRLPSWEQPPAAVSALWRVPLWPPAGAAFLIVFAAGGGLPAARRAATALTARSTGGAIVARLSSARRLMAGRRFPGRELPGLGFRSQAPGLRTAPCAAQAPPAMPGED